MAEKLVPVNVTVSSMEHDLASPVKTDSSFWTIEDYILHSTLRKRDKGQTWSSPIEGQGQLDLYATDLEQKHLMLQRFQEEVKQTKKGLMKRKNIQDPTLYGWH